MYETLDLRREGHLTWLTLNRPDALNAMNQQLVRELRQFLWELPDDTETRVVVLRGAGRAFCAGLDLKEPPSEVGAVRDRRAARAAHHQRARAAHAARAAADHRGGARRRRAAAASRWRSRPTCASPASRRA